MFLCCSTIKRETNNLYKLSGRSLLFMFPNCFVPARSIQQLCVNGLHQNFSVSSAALVSSTSLRRFQRPSGRTLFSDEGGFTFSEALEGALHEDLKETSPSESFKRASPSEGGTWRRLQGSFKGASKELQRGLKRAWSLPKVKEASRGLKGAWRGFQGGFTFGRLQRGLKGALKGFKGAWRGLETFRRWRGLRTGLKRAWRGLQEGLTFGRL